MRVTPPASTPSVTTDASLQRLNRKQATKISSRGSRTPRSAPRVSADAIGKSKHGPGSTDAIKIKKKAPWGVLQLRDSWSEDAMSKRDRENMDERIHREHRYHPDEFRRRYIRYTAFLTVPCIMLGMSITYYCETGRPIWTADPQHLLNLLRVMDTSPRSRLYAYKLEESERLPPHVLAYRVAHEGKRAYDERVFRLTNSAFQRPSEDALRQLEAEEQLRAAEATSVGDVAVMEAADAVASDEE
ncbi:hypothetical protein ABL78_3007 [Leptomonas seymouri]|uniref:Uncharacterized protein n=1 Tax=Leptomonas seymouri TaxID=5684 RepID=A0A0N0P744_LEPSE|nr:hypothetical protein ABL78_3007 [Leptomonas seymouri]|eukprot:KPI87897.1 hypothetical protein ABL78_3007 [Leptomonas seymouri]